MADKNRTDSEFKEVDYFYLKLQPYKQSNMELGKHFKLNLRFYRSYKVL